MTEYCPECGHAIPVEVGFGSSCSHCRWSGLVASKDPRRDTRDDLEPTHTHRPFRVDPGAPGDDDDRDW